MPGAIPGFHCRMRPLQRHHQFEVCLRVCVEAFFNLSTPIMRGEGGQDGPDEEPKDPQGPQHEPKHVAGQKARTSSNTKVGQPTNSPKPSKQKHHDMQHKDLRRHKSCGPQKSTSCSQHFGCLSLQLLERRGEGGHSSTIGNQELAEKVPAHRDEYLRFAAPPADHDTML